MTTREFLKLAEEVADLHGVYSQFTQLYLQHRANNSILSSVEHALTTLNLWETYNQYR